MIEKPEKGITMIIQKYDFSRYDYTVQETEQYLCEVVKSKYGAMKTPHIFEALALAKRVHAPHLRDNNAPFIIHPMRVALMLAKLDNKTTSKVLVASLLHDTIEKSCLTDREIEQSFGSYVAKLVQSVTRRQNTSSLEEKREAKRQMWQEIMRSSHEVRTIKTLEDLDNMICWKAIPEGSPARRKIPRWLKEAQEMSLPLAHATNEQAYYFMQREIAYYVKQGYGDQPITK